MWCEVPNSQYPNTIYWHVPGKPFSDAAVWQLKDSLFVAIIWPSINNNSDGDTRGYYRKEFDTLDQAKQWVEEQIRPRSENAA